MNYDLERVSAWYLVISEDRDESQCKVVCIIPRSCRAERGGNGRSQGSTLAEILDVFVGMFPKAKGLAASSVFALNQEYVSSDRVVKEGDEIVFIPPVSGGQDV